uniref:Uncharacterized protein n=1 Tax=Anguilla anguilla TaxID=7936 RepID=A0A0E9QC52_ANGAN
MVFSQALCRITGEWTLAIFFYFITLYHLSIKCMWQL